jgi:type II restriction enzyme
MSVLEKAIMDCIDGKLAFAKFISANDAGATGSHQAGIYIPLNSWEILFDCPGIKGENKDRNVKIRWQDDFETDSRFIYYGRGTRNEYRITRFGKGFPFLRPECVGDLFVLVKVDSDYYHGYVIQGDENIDSFLSSVGIGASQTNCLIRTDVGKIPEKTLDDMFMEFISSLEDEFPETAIMSAKAREFYNAINRRVAADPDSLLLGWLDTEYSLFKAIENARYKSRISRPFSSVEELIQFANTLLNRRKSRAGKSLEHHLAAIFRMENLKFGTQVETENRNKPDFIFPGGDAYHDPGYPESSLVFLGAKTTCKDRWRQILKEADRIREKHLFTLQQGISEHQLAKMYENNIVLVVPRPYLNSFPSGFRSRILTLGGFMAKTKSILAFGR